METYADRIRFALEVSGKTQTQLANAVGIKQQTVQYLCSKGKGSRHNQAIAGFLGISPAWLESGKGSMHEKIMAANVSDAEDFPFDVPVISWVRAGEFCESPDLFQPGDCDEWVGRMPGCSKSTYALRVMGDSMTSPYPGQKSYPEGMIIYVDPEREVLPGNRGIFRLPNSNDVTFKELVNDSGAFYLKPLNPQYEMIKVTKDIVSCGRVIGTFSGE